MGRKSAIFQRVVFGGKRLNPFSLHHEKGIKVYKDFMERRKFFESTEFDKGYFQALTDVIDWIDRHSESFKFYRLQYTQMSNMLKVMRENKELLQNLELGMTYNKEAKSFNAYKDNYF